MSIFPPDYLTHIESLRLNYKTTHYKDILKQDAFKNASDDELEAQIRRNLYIMDSINIEEDNKDE